MTKRKISDYFIPEDLSRITSTVAEIESRTSAEIVPSIIERSDDYEEAFWRAGGLTTSMVLGLFGILTALTDVWLPFGLTGAIAIALLSVAVVMLKVRWIPALRRFFAGRELMTLRVTQMARETFLSEQVFNTRGRTGILLFVSLLEHKVVVLADTGIGARMRNDEWDAVVDYVVKGVRSGKPAEGVVEALREMANLLERHGFTRAQDDRNELSDRPREQRRPT
jgi:putative membrane protein